MQAARPRLPTEPICNPQRAVRPAWAGQRAGQRVLEALEAVAKRAVSAQGVPKGAAVAGVDLEARGSTEVHHRVPRSVAPAGPAG
jgi:hypothetical protein